MFGLMKPDMERLQPAQAARHRTYYCGLCHGVGVHVGHAWRGIHSHDAVFLATLADGLVDAPASPSSCRCPMLPVVHRRTRDPSSVALRFAVGSQLLLADQWVADKAEEGSRAARFARDVLERPVGRGREVLEAMGLDVSDLQGFEKRQTAVEDIAGVEIEAAARPTAEALALLFARIADLPGGPVGEEAGLSELGAAIGTLIYLVDALEDLEEDAGDGSFNACLREGLPDARRIERAGALLERQAERIQTQLARLPFTHNRDLVEATTDAVVRRGRDALELARDKATDSGRDRLVRWLAQPFWVHAAAAWMTALLSFWAALSTTARAAPDQAGQAMNVMISWVVPQAQKCPCENCNKCGDSCKNCGDGCKDCGDGCKRCGDGCEGCCDGCDDCAKNFTSCCDGFNDCMNGCNAFLR